jgi:2-polyprenyl-3-methyl-5-hydroxy-6-metoxy-1,4-benzoquinol methylase
MEKKLVERYFSENAKAWITDAYVKGDYNYPVGYHRNRIVTGILGNVDVHEGKKMIDFGCGGGDLCFATAGLGYSVTGVDQSKDMIDICLLKKSSEFKELSSSINFIHCNLEDAPKNFQDAQHDIITAMGFIGYLPSDDILFSIANKLLKPGGKLIVSCRNRLFNVFSGSKYLPLEIENDFADSLVQEANRLFHQVPAGLAEKFLISLKETSSHILETDFGKSNKNEHTDPEFKSEIEAKQHTPEQIKHVAESNGFTIKKIYREVQIFSGLKPRL